MKVQTDNNQMTNNPDGKGPNTVAMYYINGKEFEKQDHLPTDEDLQNQMMSNSFSRQERRADQQSPLRNDYGKITPELNGNSDVNEIIVKIEMKKF